MRPMQVMDEKKRSKILAAAAELFATQPFHRVLLSDVAETAGVGKGTLYVYFKNKDDLYWSVLFSGSNQLLARLRQKTDHNGSGATENLGTIIRELVGFAYQNPHMFELMRTITWHQANNSDRWNKHRMEFRELIESVIRKGIECGEFYDPHPELTARFIPSLVRSVMIEGAKSVDQHMLADHIVRFTRSALLNGKHLEPQTNIHEQMSGI